MSGYYALLGRGPSLFDIAQASGMTRMQRDARELQNQQLERQDRLDDLELRKQGFNEEKYRYDTEQAQKAEAAKALDNRKMYYARLLRERPQDAERIGAAARQHGIEIENPATLTLPGGERYTGPFDHNAAAMRLEGEAAGGLGAPKPENSPEARMSAFARQLIDAGVPQGSEQFNAAMRRYNEAQLVRMEREPKGMTINVGGEAAPKVKADQQQALIDVMQTSAMLDDLEELAIDPQTGQVNFGQYLGINRAKQWTLAQLDKIGAVPDSERPQFERAQQFRAVLDKYRSEEYKRLLGSAQSEAEIKNLVNSVISADMGSTQFSQAFAALRRATARNERIAQRVLREGFDLGTAEYRRRFAELEGEGGGRGKKGGAQPDLTADDAAYFDANFAGGQ